MGSTTQSGTAKKEPAASRFKQQKLRAWQPVLTARWVIGTFLGVAVIFIPVGIALLVASHSVVEATVRYDDSCAHQSICSILITVPKEMKQPVYMYYELRNFYQNHRKYVSSRNDAQLHGSNVTTSTGLDTCKPLIEAAISSQNLTEIQRLYNPCGLVAYSMFNDTFTLKKQSTIVCDGENPTAGSSKCRKHGIAWQSDIDEKYKPKAAIPGQVTEYNYDPNHLLPNATDEDFMVWMRTAALPRFRKLYRIVETDLVAGNYSVLIKNRYPVSSFSGEKHVVLSTATWMGGKNDFLGAAYISVGTLSVILCLVIFIKEKLLARKSADNNNMMSVRVTRD